MKFAITLLFAVSACGALLAEKHPFSRYESILDRHPFGQPPPGFNPNELASEAARAASAKPEKELTKEQEVLQKSVVFNALNVEAGGTVMVGFTDKSDAKKPRCHYMRVGAVEDGWTVKDADPVANTAVIEKDGVELTLCLGAESSATTSAASAGAAPASDARSALLSTRASGAPSSHRSRRAEREAKAKAEREKAAAEAEQRREAAKQEIAEMLAAEREKAAAEREKAAAEREREKEEQRKALEELREAQRKRQEEEPPGGDEEEEDAQD